MIVKRARLPLGAVGIQLLAESQCLSKSSYIYVLNMEQGPNPPLNPYSNFCAVDESERKTMAILPSYAGP